MKRSPVAVRWATYVAVAIAFAIACAFLADWQFTRNADRADQLELVESNYDAPPRALDDVIPSGAALPASEEWQPVLLRGEYLADEQLLVRNRPHGGTAAFEVLVPFRMEDGRVLIVNRGWVPPGPEGPDPESVPSAPSGEVEVVVRLRPGEALPSSGRTADEGQVPTINLPFIAERLTAATAQSLERSAYGIMATEDPAPETRPVALSAPSEDPGPHLSYAIQWILFAIMGFIFIGYVIRTEIRARREDAEEGDADAAARSSAPTPRRRDRDAEDEDALLDATR